MTPLLQPLRSPSTLGALAAGLVAGYLVGKAGEAIPAGPTGAPAWEAAAAPLEGTLLDDEALEDPALLGLDGPPVDSAQAPREAGATCGGDGLPELDEVRQLLMLNSGVLAGKLGAERTGQEALRERFPPFPGAGPLIPLGDEIVANHIPMNLAVFETRADPGEVLEHYALHFTKMNWAWQGVLDNAEVVPYPAISATDPAERLQMSVMVIRHPDGSSTVVLGLADMTVLDTPPLVPDTGDLPVYPGTQPLAVRSTDSELHSWTVSFVTPDAPEKVESFYRDQLTALGFRALMDEQEAMEGAPEGTLRRMRFASAQRAWSFTISSHDGQTAVTALGSLAEVLP